MSFEPGLLLVLAQDVPVGAEGGGGHGFESPGQIFWQGFWISDIQCSITSV